MHGIFRKAAAGEAEIVYTMIADRVHWMDRKGLHQWNTTDYLNVYPLAYYREHLDQLYVLTDESTEQILCAAILLEQDPRWDSAEPAFYIHNLVSGVQAPGAGKNFLQLAEQYALAQGKRYLRLDSADDNLKLAEYYGALGFTACGFCRDGAYHGILRQKRLPGRPETGSGARTEGACRL